jgi:hypothetical protein
MRGDPHELARQRLAWVLPQPDADRVMGDLLGALGLARVSTGQDLLQLGQALERQGGLLGELVGPLLILHSRAYRA